MFRVSTLDLWGTPMSLSTVCFDYDRKFRGVATPQSLQGIAVKRLRDGQMQTVNLAKVCPILPAGYKRTPGGVEIEVATRPQRIVSCLTPPSMHLDYEPICTLGTNTDGAYGTDVRPRWGMRLETTCVRHVPGANLHSL